MSKIIKIIDYIKAHSAKLTLGTLASYETIPTTADLVNEDIPSWKNVNDITGAIPPAPLELDVINAGTTIPYFLDTFLYPDFTQYAEIVTKTKDGDNYIRWVDMQITEVFSGSDFTGWNVQLHTNDNTVSSEDVYIVLKP